MEVRDSLVFETTLHIVEVVIGTVNFDGHDPKRYDKVLWWSFLKGRTVWDKEMAIADKKEVVIDPVMDELMRLLCGGFSSCSLRK